MELATANQGGGNFTPTPEGMHAAVCYRFIDLGTQKVEWQGQIKQQRKILLSFELYETEDEFTDQDGNAIKAPFTMHQRFTWSMHEKGKLRPFLEAWRGRSFSDTDLAPGGFDARNMIGAPAYLNVVHVEKDGRIYANIRSINPLPEKLYGDLPTGHTPESKIARTKFLHNSPLYLALTPELFDKHALDALSDRIKETIEGSPEYKRATGQEPERPPEREDFTSDTLDDDIPF